MSELSSEQRGIMHQGDLTRMGLDQLSPEIQEASAVLAEFILGADLPEVTLQERKEFIIGIFGLHYNGENGRVIQEEASPDEITLLTGKNPHES